MTDPRDASAVGAVLRRREKDYRLPTPQSWPEHLRLVLSVDKDLDTRVLDRLNLISGIKVVSTCQGHPTGAHIGFEMIRRGGLNGSALAKAVGARWCCSRCRTFFIERPSTDPHDGPRWFNETVGRIEREAVRLRQPESAEPQCVPFDVRLKDDD